MYRMVIADDEEIILQGLREIVDWRSLGFELIACYQSGDALLDALRSGLSVDAILTDIRMESVSGIDVARYVQENGLHVEVALLSGYRDFEYARQGMMYGVAEYLTKPCAIVDIQAAFTRVAGKLDRERAMRAMLEARAFSSSPGTPHGVELDPVSGGAHVPAVRAACDFIRANCGQALSLTSVARKTFMHPSYLSRVFKQVTGKTFKAFLTTCRVERANVLLSDPTIKVYDIALQVGYRDIRHFYEVYKRQTGRTPSMYRTELGMRNLSEEGDARA